MNVLILSSDSNAESNQLLIQSLQQKNIQVECRDPRHFEWNLKKKIFVDGQKKIKFPDLVVPRLGFYTFNSGIRLLSAMEAQGALALNSWHSIERSHRKDFCLNLLNQAGLEIPETWMFHLEKEPQFIEQIRAKTLILKTLSGSQGRGVARASTRTDQRAWIDFLRTSRSDFMTQEFLLGSDVRSLWFRGVHLGSMIRTAAAGEFRSNLHRGGTGKKTTLSSREINLCQKALEILGLDLAGIDWIRTKKGPVFLEVNAFPGFAGISQVFETQFSELIAEGIIQKINSQH